MHAIVMQDPQEAERFAAHLEGLARLLRDAGPDGAVVSGADAMALAVAARALGVRFEEQVVAASPWPRQARPGFSERMRPSRKSSPAL